MRRFRWTLIVAVLSMISCYAHAAGITVVNGRYFADASGTPKFLIGYHDYSVGHTAFYSAHTLQDQINIAEAYKLNYVRVLAAQNYYDASDSYEGIANRTPWTITGGKYVLNSWDTTYWSNLRADIAYAQARGVIVHLAIFESPWSDDAPWGWTGSPWNTANHYSAYFPSIDTNSDGDAGDANEFFNATAFTNGTGVGYYQKAFIDKLIAEVDGYPNVIYEIGNETFGNSIVGSPSWISAVKTYMATKTNKPVSVCICSSYASPSGCGIPPPSGSVSGVNGFDIHGFSSVAGSKSRIEEHVGNGFPVLIDPDSNTMDGATATDFRQMAWYALTGGATGFGGFSGDVWWTEWETEVPQTYPNTTKATYLRYVSEFVDNNAVRFWEMTPQPSLISANTTNSLLAKVGAYYLGYVLSGATVDITLDTGTYSVNYFNPVTGVTTFGTDTTGPATRTFSRPTGASDWVVFVSKNTALPGGGSPAQDTVPIRRPVAPSMLTVR